MRGSIYKRKRKLPDGSIVEIPTWYIQYCVHGKLFKESTGSTKHKDAVDLLNRRIGEMQNGKLSGGRADKTKVAELLQALLANYRENKVAWLSNAAEPTVRNRLIPFFGDFKANDLSTAIVDRYKEERLAHGAANATINRELAMLRRAFNLGMRATPPKVTRVPYFASLKEDNIRKGFFEHDEFLKVREHLPEEIQPLLTFAYYTGCRKSEILSLRWEQVDLERGIARLEVGETKNGEARVIPLVPELRDALKAQKALRDQTCPNCPTVFFRAGGKPIKDFRESWDNACRLAGVPSKLLHDMRRTGVRNLVRAGVPEAVAMRISGHKTRAVFERYNIVNEADLIEAARKLANYTTPIAPKLPQQDTQPQEASA
jgi:integrase